MDVEVDDGDALEAVHGQCARGAHGDVVDEAEAHRLAAHRVVAWRTHAAERVACGARHDGVGGRDRGARRAPHRVDSAGTHHRVRVERFVAFERRRPSQVVDVRLRVDAQQVLVLDERHVAVRDQFGEAARDHAIVDGTQPGRRLGMPGTHLVGGAVGMREPGGDGGAARRRRQRRSVCRRRGVDCEGHTVFHADEYPAGTKRVPGAERRRRGRPKIMPEPGGRSRARSGRRLSNGDRMSYCVTRTW